MTRRHDEVFTPLGRPNTLARICVADLNEDGRMDLLLGDWYYETVELPELTGTQGGAQGRRAGGKKDRSHADPCAVERLAGPGRG